MESNNQLLRPARLCNFMISLAALEISFKWDCALEMLWLVWLVWHSFWWSLTVRSDVFTVKKRRNSGTEFISHQVLAKFVFQHWLSVKALFSKVGPLHYKTNEKKTFWVLLLLCFNCCKLWESFVAWYTFHHAIPT